MTQYSILFTSIVCVFLSSCGDDPDQFYDFGDDDDDSETDTETDTDDFDTESESGSDGDSDSDSDSDGDSDADSDSNTSSDLDSDSDVDSDSDTDSDTDTDGDTDTETETETETTSDTETDTGIDTDSETETETETETESDTDTGSEPDTDTGSDTEPEQCDSPAPDNRSIVCVDDVCLDQFSHPEEEDDWGYDWCWAWSDSVENPRLDNEEEIAIYWNNRGNQVDPAYRFDIPDYACAKVVLPENWEFTVDVGVGEHGSLTKTGNCYIFQIWDWNTFEEGIPFGIGVKDSDPPPSGKDGWVYIQTDVEEAGYTGCNISCP